MYAVNQWRAASSNVRTDGHEHVLVLGVNTTSAAVFHDQVNLHLVRVVGNPLLLSVFEFGWVHGRGVPRYGPGNTRSWVAITLKVSVWAT